MSFLDSLANNPVLASIGHAAGSLWGMTNLAQRLRASADQHQQMLQAQKVRDFDMAMRQKEFDQRQGQQDFQHQAQTSNFLANALSAGGRILSPGETAGNALPTARDTSKPAWDTQLPNVENPANTITAPGGQQRVYYPGAQETAARTQQERVGLQEQLNRVNERPIPDQWAEDYGLPLGTKVPQTGFDTMLGRVITAKEASQRAADKPEKVVNLHPVVNKANGDVTMIDPTTGDVKKIIKGAGGARPAKGERGEKTATPTQLNSIEGRKRTALARAEVAYKRAMASAKIGDVTDTEAAQQAAEDLQQSKQAAQDAYEQELQQFHIPTEHYEYGNSGGGAGKQQPSSPAAKAATAATPASPAQQPQQPQQPQPAAARPKNVPKHYIRVQAGTKKGWVDPRDFNPQTMNRLD